MVGLLFIMEFCNWTHEEADDAYMFNIDAQYALNLQPENQRHAVPQGRHFAGLTNVRQVPG